MNNIKIEAIGTGKQLKKFIHFPWQVYRDYPHWVPPLLVDFKQKIDPDKNPFFKHAEMELFLASRNGRICGRIAAIKDDHHNRYHSEKTAFFGLYESFDDIDTAGALLGAAAEWAQKHGMDRLRGPMNLSMNDECGFLLEGFDSPPAIMMPYTPPYYLDLMENCGLIKAKDLHAFIIRRDPTYRERTRRIWSLTDQIRQKTNITLRTINLKNIEVEAELIRHIYNRSWTKNWGFVPWTREEMAHTAANLKLIADPDLVLFAEDNGKAVGFGFGLPNYNEVIKKIDGKLGLPGIIKFLVHRGKITGVRFMVFGILEEYRLTGVSYLLYAELARRALSKKYHWSELSWQLEDNHLVNKFVASFGGESYKKYRIFEKELL